ncbi:MAG: DUF1016 N-terminal domain-containing protein [Pseudomonadota bacterium]
MSPEKLRIRDSQYASLKSVNTELVGLCWELGRMIVERQERDGWGSAVRDNSSVTKFVQFRSVIVGWTHIFTRGSMPKIISAASVGR